MRLFFLFVCMLLFPLMSLSKTKVALIYAKNFDDISSISNELSCISEALVNYYIKKGDNIDYKFFNNERNPLLGTKIAKKIIDGKYDIAVGTSNSNEAIPISTLLNNAKIPFIAPTATNPKVTDNRPYTFTVPTSDRRQGMLLAKYAKKYLKNKKVFIIYNYSSPYSTFLGKTFRDELKQIDSKIKIIEDGVISGQKEYSQLIKKVNKFNPDLIFIPLHASNFSNMYLAFKREMKTYTFLAGDSIGGRKNFFMTIGKVVDRIKLYFIKNWDGKLHGKYLSLYKKLMKNNCKNMNNTMISVSAFDALNLAILSSKKSNGKNIIKQIKESQYDGVMGPLEYRSSNVPYRNIYLNLIIQDSFRFVRELK